jgi:hypothetical protein
MPTPMTKTFDALEMSRRLREQTSRKLAGLSREQRLALLNGHIRAPGKVPPKEQAVLREDSPSCGGEQEK